VDALTERAERALLGAMIEDPHLTGRLRISPHELAGERHAAVYLSIRQARQATFAGADGWRAAILRAGPSLAGAELDDLVRACPFAPHGPAYAVMVVQAWARRHLDQSARILGTRGGLLELDAQRVVPADEAAGTQMAATAGHLQQVAFAISEHARVLGPPPAGPSSGPRQRGSLQRARREEAVLAGLLRQDPERNADILRALPAGAFANPHRREVYQVASAMYQAGKPVDELTLDWELASRGVPLDAGQSPGAARDGGTYAMRLARLEIGYQEPATAAEEMAAEYRQSRTGHSAGSARLRAVRTPAPAVRPQAPAAGTPRPVLRLVQPPPQPGGPGGPGPRQAR
jgi:hypothetical protein